MSAINDSSSNAKQELLKHLLKKKGIRLTSETIQRRTQSTPAPLSFAEQRLWFLYQLEGENSTYNLPFALLLNGNLNVVALEGAIAEILRRHEVLRTRFQVVNDTPVQVIDPETTVTLKVVDLQDLPETEQLTTVKRLVTIEAEKPFDLANDPLVRVHLWRVSSQSHVLLINIHHIVFDGWSMGIFTQELSALYKAFLSGDPSPLPELPIQYTDFAVWQRQLLTGEVLEKQLDYWKQQLAGAPEVLALPIDRPRQAVLAFRGATVSFLLPHSLSKALKALSKRTGVTLFMTLYAAFVTLLYRYTGSDDIVVGTPTANRNRQEIEGLIGFFVNTLVLRTDLSDNPIFEDLLSRVRDVMLGAYAHQDLPFEKLVEELKLERDLSYTPLVQVMLVLNEPMPQVQVARLTVSPLPIETATAKFDLTLFLENTASGLIGNWEYNTDLFDASTIARIAEHFQTLLEGIVANPQQQVSQLPLLTLRERHQLLVEWNNTTKEYPQDKCIHQLFEEQVELTPDAIAVVFEDKQLTYRELNQRANCLAHHLQRQGVEPEILVGICVERSLEMIVGFLGILKTGGAYVPLDPSYPQERLAFMLKDAQVSVLLTQQQLVEKLPEHQARLVCLDTEWEAISQQSKEELISEVTPDRLAYVIYTSGSTGKPKGVCISHRAVNRLVLNTNYVKLEPSDRVAQASNCSFDAATFEIWGALLHGSRLVGVTKDVALSPKDFATQVREQGISVLFLTTALFNQLAKEVPSAFYSVRHLLFGGEAVDPRLVKMVLENSPPQRLLHVYGPTESTTFASWHLVQEVPEGVTTIPIGGPLSNTQIYLLDNQMQPVPVGVPGELYIGGDGLARGYLNRPELTAERFILNPFSNEPGAHLYKTGDLARYLSDGNIEFIGRIDNQVKIRGFRIELGEIEAALAQYPGVRETAVIAREDVPGRKYLAAYIVPNRDSAIASSDLRGFLKEKLPDYMVPSAIVMLESLPLTPNGKVDRRALPEPELHRELLDKYVAPRTPIEEMLVQIWVQVLRVKQVGIHDNFFELGGDSILSIQIIARANQQGIVLSPKQLFMHQTIAELAAVAGTTEAVVAEQGLVTGASPLTPIQHWFFEQNLPQPHHFNQSFLLSVPAEWKPELLQQVVQYLLLHHDTLRLRFVLSESDWQQTHVRSNDNAAFCFFDLSKLPPGEQTIAIETTAAQLQASLNLSKDLVRVAFFRLGVDKPSRLLIVIHHLVVDGVSWRILLEDLQTAYQQLCQGKTLELPPKTTSFKDWAHRLAEYAPGVVLKSELTYWLSKSRDSVSSIPVDYAEGVNTVASVGTVRVSLNEAQTKALLQDVPKAYNTQINDVLLTALVQVLGKWTSSNSVLLDLEGHGREDILEDVDLSRTIGWFTTIFPVLVELQATENLADALKSVKEQLRAIPNKGIGYGLLRYLSQDAEIAAQLQALPQAQISFNYLGQFDQLFNTSSWMQLAGESAGVEHSLNNNRIHLLDINSIITGKQLQINWTYSTNVHQHATIKNLAQEFVLTLQSLIAHCSSPECRGYTPTDFPLVKLNQKELDQFLASLVFKNQSSKTK